jgi:hypothetical protein
LAKISCRPNRNSELESPFFLRAAGPQDFTNLSAGLL